MEGTLAFLREFHIYSVALRLLLAMLLGGLVGLDRARKNRPAGFRTHMLVCMGATLTMLLGQYEYTMLHTVWAEQAAVVGGNVDVSRFGAQVINGIGFLGAGTIIVTGRQKVTGLTTAAGLWTSACMGLAIGAGFFECVLLAFLLIVLVFRLRPLVEGMLAERARNMNIYVEFQHISNISPILGKIKLGYDVHIYEVDLQRPEFGKNQNPRAVFNIRLNENVPHAKILASISELDSVLTVEEI